MHLYMVTRGVYHNRDVWLAAMQSQYFPWKRKNLKTGKEEVVMVQGKINPIELWEYIFPEESLPEVLTMLNMNKGGSCEVGVLGGHYGLKGKFIGDTLRRVLSCQKLPSVDAVPTNKFIPMMGFGPSPIGIKKDERKEWKEIGYEQEML